MALIGWKRCGWSEDPKKIKFNVLVTFERQHEAETFETFLEGLQDLIDSEKHVFNLRAT